VSYIDRNQIQPHRERDYTPGEQNMMGAYRLAAYQMSQEYAKTQANRKRMPLAFFMASYR